MMAKVCKIWTAMARERPRFIADSMLGRLATWLRVLGYDTAYDAGITDSELIRRAKREGRIILTRDRRLLKRKGIGEALLIRSDHFREQLREVVSHFGLDPRSGFLTLCIRCNTPLEDIRKEEVRDRVPPYVFRTQEDFMICPRCGRIYWGATHRERMEEEIRELFGG